MTMATMRDNVPATMRKKLARAEAIIPVVVSQNFGDDVNGAIEFIAGALDHQDKVSAKKDDGSDSAKTFPVIIDRVEIVERRASGSLLGRKAKIHYRDAKDTSKVEEIDTGWTEYHGNDAREFPTWQTSLSNTLVAIAEENKGKQCFLTKAYVPGIETVVKGQKVVTSVKFLANLEPDAREGKASGRGGSSSSSRGEGGGRDRRRSSEVSVDDLTKAVKGVQGFDAERAEAALEDAKLLRAVTSAINDGGAKAADKVFDAVLDACGDDAVSRRDEDTYFDRAEADLPAAAAWLLVASA